MDTLRDKALYPIFRSGFEGEGENGEGDDGGEGKGGQAGLTPEAVAAQIETAVSGLKSTNAKLKQEKTDIKKQFDTLSSQLAALGGEEGINKLSEFQKRLAEDESTKLLSEGKHEEWFDKRTTALRKSHEKELGTVTEQLTEANSKTEKAVAKLHQTLLKAEVLSAAKDGGTVPEAAADIQLRAERAFTWDEDSDTLVIKDDEGDIVTSKDGKSPKSVAEWLEEQKESARHWWPASKGAGAGGSGEGGSTGDEDISKLPFDSFAKKRMEQKAARKKSQGFRV